MNRILQALVFLSVIAMPLQAGSKVDAGTAGAAFMKLEAGARPAAMGNAFTAVAGDPNAVFRNPAGLAAAGKVTFAFTYGMYLEGSAGQWASYVQPTPLGVFALSVQCLSYGTMKEVSETGVEGDPFAPQDLLGVFSYAFSVQDLAVGFNAKSITATIKDTGRATAFDAGFRYGLFGDRLAVGAVYQNYGGKIAYAASEDLLPAMTVTGLYWKVNDEWVLTADYAMPDYNEPYFCVGAENGHTLGDSFAIAERLGYTSRTRELGGIQGISLGLGITAGPVGLDYALVPLGDLGITHRLSLSLAF